MSIEVVDREAATSQPHDVFVSYARQDQAFVRRLTDALAERGKRAWVDWVDIPPTAEWMAEIRAAIDAADTYVVVISPASIGSKVCAAELDSALSANKRIVPVLAVPVQDDLVPPEVAKLNWVSFTDAFEPALDKLLVALDTDLDHVKMHTRLQVRAREWDAKEGDKALLFRGRELTESEAWLSTAGSKEPHPTALQTRFLLASRRSATRRQRGAITGVTAMFLVAALFAGIAVQQRNSAVSQRRLADQRGAVAYSRQLAVESSVQVGQDPELGLLLAIESSKAAPTPEAQDALAVALGDASLRREIPDVSGIAETLVSPDGSRVLILGEGSAQLWDRNTANLVTSVPVDGPQVLGAFSESGDAFELVAAGKPAKGYSSIDGSTLPALPTSLVWSSSGTLSPTGDRFVTIKHREAALWDASTGEQVARLSGVLGPFQSSHGAQQEAFSPDGSRLAIVDPSHGRVGIYRASDGHLEFRLKTGPSTDPERFLGGVAFTADGSSLVISSANFDTVGDSRVWSLSTRRPTTSLGPGTLPPFAISDGEIAAGTLSARIELLHMTTGRRTTIPAFRDPFAYALDLAFDPSGEFVAATFNRSGDIWIWHSLDGSLVQSSHGFQVQAAGVAFTPDGRSVEAWGNDGNRGQYAREFAMIGPVAIASMSGADRANFDGVAPGPTFRALVPAATGLEVIDGQGQVVSTLAGTGSPTARWAFSPDGERAIVGYGDGSVTIFDSATGAAAASLPKQSLGVQGVALSGTGLALTYDGTGTARTWDAATGTPVSTMPVSNPLMPPRFVAGGSLVALGAWAGDDYGHDPPVMLVDARTGVVAFTDHDRHLTQLVAVTPDGARVVVLGNASTHRNTVAPVVRVFSVADGHMLFESKDALSSDLFQSEAALSPNGRWLAAGVLPDVDGNQQDDVMIWDTTTARPVAQLAHQGYVEVVAFSPDGSMLASGSWDKTVRLWQVPSGRQVRVISGFEGTLPPEALAFSPDGSLLLTADGDDVSVWRVATGALLWRIPSDADMLAFSGDGRNLLLAETGNGLAGSKVLGMSVVPCDVCGSQSELLALAQGRVYRPFTDDERQTYLGG